MPNVRVDTKALTTYLDLVRTVDEYRPGLGLLTAYTLAVRLGSRGRDLGRGLLISSPMGFGKGQLIHITNSPKLGDIVPADDLKTRWLLKWLRARRDAKKPVLDIGISVEDLSTVADDQKRLGALLNLTSKLVSDREFAPKGTYDHEANHLSAKPWTFRSASVIMGCTPRLLGRIKRFHNWSSMAKDRFTQVGILYSSANLKRQQDLVYSDGIIPKDMLRDIVDPFIPAVDPSTITLGVDRKDIKAAYEHLYANQHSPNRGPSYLIGDLKGVAAICGAEVATSAHLGALRLMAPYLQVAELSPYGSAIVAYSTRKPTASWLADEMQGDPRHASKVLSAAIPLASRRPPLLRLIHHPRKGQGSTIVRSSTELDISLASMDEVALLGDVRVVD